MFKIILVKLQVDSVPTVILFKNGDLVDRVDGADASQITSKVKIHSLGKVAAMQNPAKPPLEERLKTLINSHNVIAFIKGTRQAPRCGFTRTLIEILNGSGYVYHK